MVGIEWFMRWSPKDAAYCKADWKLYLGEDYSVVEPYLEKATGRVAGSYPGVCGNVRYEVRPLDEFWIGVPYDGGGESEESPWPRLTVEDVQVWRLSAKGIAELSRRSVNGRDNNDTDASLSSSDVQVSPDYKVIRIGKRKIDLSLKPKARAFLRFVRERMNGNGRAFEIEEMRDNFNAQFGEGLKLKGWKSDRLREDLFKGLAKGDFDLLFDTVNQTAGIYRLKI